MSDRQEMSEPESVRRARAIVQANEWEGDLRQNMTTVIGAGRVLARRLNEVEANLLLEMAINTELRAAIANAQGER